MIYKGGSAVDAAIATLFCEGVANPESMGLGGGFIMTVYKRASKTAVILNARETAPENAHKNMFANKPNLARKGTTARKCIARIIIKSLQEVYLLQYLAN